MMKMWIDNKLSLVFILVLIVFIFGCTSDNDCAFNNGAACIRSCELDSDCYFSCGCGCLNSNEFCKGEDKFQCSDRECICENNQCALSKDEIMASRINGSDSVLYYLIKVVGYKCLGCGYDVEIIAEIHNDGTITQDDPLTLVNTPYGPDTKCFYKYKAQDDKTKNVLENSIGFSYDNCLMTEDNLNKLLYCLEESEILGYCESDLHCYISVDGVCVGNKCVYPEGIE
ncbi:hypothetical protein JXC34_01095 [Candidatus Woesearchaeota archaeon]|nr:hypothetical protein [Candidatus Woesearchaeota archaeon]